MSDGELLRAIFWTAVVFVIFYGAERLWTKHKAHQRHDVMSDDWRYKNKKAA